MIYVISTEDQGVIIVSVDDSLFCIASTTGCFQSETELCLLICISFANVVKADEKQMRCQCIHHHWTPARISKISVSPSGLHHEPGVLYSLMVALIVS